MKAEMRQKLARESFAEKFRKVAQLIRLAKSFPHRNRPFSTSRLGTKTNTRSKTFSGSRWQAMQIAAYDTELNQREQC